ncbi:ABC transporter substrate-binding protein [Streptomyces sp. NPDC020917]|uniref:ABC transporter substrate-binding protein n=1 Tax=Streptomyces sp. NPDC020917 TaxID=3365102 RepID=UPI0037A68DE6
MRKLKRPTRKSVLWVTAGCCLAVLSGCAAGASAGSAASAASTGKNDKVTLTFLTFETPNLTSTVWNQEIARASAKVPGVTIKKLVAPSVDRTAYAKQLAATGQLPDLMIGVSPDGFAQAGQLAPWPDAQLKNYVDPHANQIGGKEYQLPFNTQPTPLVYYNKNDFAKAGIAGAPKTYSALLADCAKLKAKGITPFVVGGGGKDTWADMYPLIATVGTDVYAKQADWLAKRTAGDVKFTDKNFTGAAAKVSSLAKNGDIDKAGLSRSYAQTEQAFRENKGAMYPMGSWFAASADAKKPPFGVGVFPWPSDSGSLVMPAYTGGGMSVSSKAPDIALAQKWAKAFMEDKQNLDTSVRTDGSIIAIKGYRPPAGIGPVYKDTFALYENALKKHDIVNAFSIETGDNALPPGVADQAALGVQDLITGHKSPAQFSSFLDAEWAKATQ